MQVVFLAVVGVLLAAPSFAQVPNCKYGLEPGMGPMRCADPNDPHSYLNKPPVLQTPKSQRLPKRNAGSGSVAYDIEHPPPGDNLWCKNHARSATELNRCWSKQHQERLPEDIPPQEIPTYSFGQKSQLGPMQEYERRKMQNICDNPQVYGPGACKR